MLKAEEYTFIEHLVRPGTVNEYSEKDVESAVAKTYHFHSAIEVIIIRKGWIDAVSGEIFGRASAGMVAVIGSNLPHKVLNSSKDLRATLIHIPATLFNLDPEQFLEIKPGIDFLRNTRCGLIWESEKLLKTVLSISRKIDSSEGFLRISHLMELLHVLSTTAGYRTVLTSAPAIQSGLQTESALERAHKYIYKHYTENIRLQDIADAAGMDKTALCRSFKRVSNSTIVQHLTRLRVEKACSLLLTTSQSITQIAYQCGFNSFSQFSMQFRKSVGKNPSEYRSSAQTTNSGV